MTDAELRNAILEAHRAGIVPKRLAWYALGVSSDPATIAARRQCQEILDRAAQEGDCE